MSKLVFSEIFSLADIQRRRQSYALAATVCSSARRHSTCFVRTKANDNPLTDTVIFSSSFCDRSSKSKFFHPLKGTSKAEETYRAKRRSYLSQTHYPVEQLSSKSGSTVKLFASVATRKKARLKNNLSVVEGHRAVLDLLQQKETRHLIQHVLITEDALDTAVLGSKLANELDLSQNSKEPKNIFKINFVTDDIMKICTDTVRPQGVVALCSIPPVWDPPTLSKDDHMEKSLYLILDGVSDPGNMGTIFRSSLAVNAKAIFLLPNCVDAFSPKVVRSAMGCTFRVPVSYVESMDQCLVQLQERCLVSPNRVFAATMDTSEEGIDGGKIRHTSQPYNAIQWADGPCALCIGKEGQGLSNEVREAVRRGDISSTHVPMANRLESLNAAVCASVIMFEYSRQVREEVDASRG